MRLKKPEAVGVQGLCVLCGVNKQTSRGGGKYRPTCGGCHNQRRGLARNHYTIVREHPYRFHKGFLCERCGFEPEHSCQLDVDHIDGNHDNNKEENLMTLCSNCHRLKTYLNKDYKK